MRVRSGPIFTLPAPGDSATIDPRGKDIPALRRTTAQPVRGSKACRPGQAVLASQQHGEDLAAPTRLTKR